MTKHDQKRFAALREQVQANVSRGANALSALDRWHLAQLERQAIREEEERTKQPELKTN